MSVRYAAYGSNLHPLRLQARVGMARRLGTSVLEDTALRFHKRGNIDGSGKCNFIGHPGERLHLAVYELPEAAIAALDAAEGAGFGYEQSTIRVDGFGECMTYLAQSSHIDETLEPFTWYKALVLAGCRWHRFPGAYIEAIEATPAAVDPDQDRHARHLRLLEALGSDSTRIGANL